MKKVLALVLAVAMMATVAFAVTPDDIDPRYNPGSEIEIGSSDLGADRPVNSDTSKNVKLNTKNFSIKKVTYNDGKSFVDSITLVTDEDEDKVTVTLKEDYTTDKTKPMDLTIELRSKSRYVEDVTIDVVTTVGFELKSVDLNDTKIDNILADDEDKLVKITADGTEPYATLYQDDIMGVADLEVRVYEKDKFYWNVNADADKKVLIANADADAEISFLNFEGKPSFNSTATLYFYDVEEDGFVYELTAAGQIKKSAAKWSEDDGCWVLKTRTLGSYVFSDKALASAAAADDTTTNPDTGANDVVGIATALAVVSLVAAGAVSLKK